MLLLRSFLKDVKYLPVCLPVAQILQRELLALRKYCWELMSIIWGQQDFVVHGSWSLVPEIKGDNLERGITVGTSLFNFLIDTNCNVEQHVLFWIQHPTSLSVLGSCMKWIEVTQSCPTLCDPMDCSLSGSSVHGIFQARILEWVMYTLGKIQLSHSMAVHALVTAEFQQF